MVWALAFFVPVQDTSLNAWLTMLTCAKKVTFGHLSLPPLGQKCACIWCKAWADDTREKPPVDSFIKLLG
jgi:hypothetical protein